jgi:hypothetical protein
MSSSYVHMCTCSFSTMSYISRTHTHTLTHTNTLTHAQHTNMRTHTNTHTHAHTHTHTHAHIHAHINTKGIAQAMAWHCIAQYDILCYLKHPIESQTAEIKQPTDQSIAEYSMTQL